LTFGLFDSKIEAMAARPLLEALDLLGRRWALRIVWELRRDALGFAELRRRAGVSSSVLAHRLRELEAAGVLEHGDRGRYRLTAAGRELGRVLFELNRWAELAAREREKAILAD
jgi:DNA-binding HxlR family transcriptional regulator